MAALASPALAAGNENASQPDTDSKNAGREAEIVVHASRLDSSVYDNPLHITVVDERELRERAPRTPAEALRGKSGVWIQRTGHLGGAPIIRGFMGNRVIYLFDGIRRNTAGLFKGPNSFLQNIDALDVDRIELIRGPASVLYGSDAIGGIVNVVTNETPRFTDHLQVGGRSYVRYASVDDALSGRQELHVSGQQFYAFIGGTLRDINDVEGGRGLGTLRPTDWREKNWDLQLDYKIAEGHRLEFFFQDFSRPFGSRYDRPNWKQSNDRELYGLRYAGRDLGPLASVDATIYFHKQDNFIDEKHWDSDGRDRTWGGEIQAKSQIADLLTLVYGFHMHRDTVKKSNPQKKTRDPDVEWTNPAFFVLSQWQLLSRLRLDLGLRWDRFTLKSQAPPVSKLDAAVQDAINNGSFSLRDLELDRTDDALTGGLGLSFDVTDEIRLVGHVGRAFRAPNKSDMLRFGQFTFGFNTPSANLDPESSWTFELGARGDTELFSAGLTGFYTILQDAIVSVPGTFDGKSFIDVNGNGVQDSDEGVFVKKNASGDIVATGVEFDGTFRVPEGWTEMVLGDAALSLYGNFSWIWGKDKGADEPLDRGFPANGLIGLRVDDDRDPERSDWWIAAEAWIVDDFHRIPGTRLAKDPAFRFDPQDKSSGPLRAGGYVPGFTVYNIRGGFNVTDHARVTLGVNNVTNKKYRVKDSRLDAPGTSATLALEVRF